jgi:hypothetical protein
MLDITKLLQDAIYLDNQLIDKRDLLLGPDGHLKEIMVRLDQALAHCYQSQFDYGLVKQEPLTHDELVDAYTVALQWMLIFSARKQWTHLVVMDKDVYQRLLAADPVDKGTVADQQYLAIKQFMFSAYTTHQQDDYRHAWHLFLKWGLVDLKLTEKEIMKAHDHLVSSLLGE